MYKNNPNKIRPSVLESFIPGMNAKQTTEVFMSNGKLKLQVKRQDYSVNELIKQATSPANTKIKQPRREFILT
jgi:hypothetical protein